MNLDLIIEGNKTTLSQMRMAFLKVGKSNIVGKDTVLELIIKCIRLTEEMHELLVAANNVPIEKIQRETHDKVESIAAEVSMNTHRIGEFISLRDIGNLPD